MENPMSEERINQLLAEGFTIDQIDAIAYKEAENAYLASCGNEAKEVRL